MRAAFIGMFLLNGAAAWLLLPLLPEPAAVHFGADGLADGWLPRRVHAELLTGLNVIVFLALQIPHRLLRLPARWVNLPRKEYWLSPDQLPQAQALLRAYMETFGVAIFLFLLAVNLLLVQANRVCPPRLDLRWFLPAVGGFLLFTAGWTVAVCRAFRRASGTRAIREY